MRRLTNFLSRMLLPALVALAVFIGIASFTWDLAFINPVPEEAAFDTSLHYSPDEVQGKYNWYTEAQRNLYIRNAFTFDLAFPVLYVFVLLTACAFFIKRLNSGPLLGLAYLVPFMAGLADIAENSTISWIMAHGVTQTNSLAASVLTEVKWALLYASIGILGLLFLLYSFKLVFGKSARWKR